MPLDPILEGDEIVGLYGLPNKTCPIMTSLGLPSNTLLWRLPTRCRLETSMLSYDETRIVQSENSTLVHYPLSQFECYLEFVKLFRSGARMLKTRYIRVRFPTALALRNMAKNKGAPCWPSDPESPKPHCPLSPVA